MDDELIFGSRGGGRKSGLACAAFSTIIGTLIQGLAINEAMFCMGRLVSLVLNIHSWMAHPSATSST